MTPSSPGPEARIGQVVDARYRIVEHIASGGMASVYRAEHVINGSTSAIKVLHPEFGEHDEVAARFQRELQAYRTVQHPHVVAAWDFGRLPDGCLYMVLEYIRGQDLLELLYREKPLDQVRAVKIALQVSLALIAAHNAGVVHRDLKPDNIMLVERDGDPDYVKVVDFGIAKMAPRGGRALTALGSVFGTPDYMAPEQARGGQIDHRSDLYTLGVVLYEMLAGQTPFSSESGNIADVILAQVTKPPPPLPPHIDPELSQLVIYLLAKDPAKRESSAIELAERLRRILLRLAPNHPVLASPAVTSLAGIVAHSGMAPLQPAPAPAPAAPPSRAQAPLSARVVEIAHAPAPRAPAPQQGGFAPVALAASALPATQVMAAQQPPHYAGAHPAHAAAGPPYAAAPGPYGAAQRPAPGGPQMSPSGAAFPHSGYGVPPLPPPMSAAPPAYIPQPPSSFAHPRFAAPQPKRSRIWIVLLLVVTLFVVLAWVLAHIVLAVL